MKEDILRLKGVWQETLRVLGSERRLLALEEQVIAKAIQVHGAEATELALYGARFEPANQNFNPRDYIDIQRVLTKDKTGRERIGRFVDLGARARKRTEPKNREPTTSESEEHMPMPEDLKAKLGPFFRNQK